MDLTHAIPRQDVMRGALTLGRATAYMPADAVYVAVVDPGVGSERRSIAVRASLGRAPGGARQRAAVAGVGGARRCRSGGRDHVRMPSCCTRCRDTFHGRDVFAPAAAHLAAGVPLEDARPGHRGRRADRRGAARPDGGGRRDRRSRDRHRRVRQRAAERRDRTDLEAAGLGADPDGAGPRGAAGGHLRRRCREGTLGAIIDSQGQLALVVNQGSAAEMLGLATARPWCSSDARGPQGDGLSDRLGSCPGLVGPCELRAVARRDHELRDAGPDEEHEQHDQDDERRAAHVVEASSGG